MKLISVASLLLALFILPRGQETASVSGYVTDEHGSAIPRAVISLRRNFSGEVARAKSGSSGFYRIGDLPQGRYSAFASAEGYGCVWTPSVILFAGTETALDFVMHAGAERCK